MVKIFFRLTVRVEFKDSATDSLVHFSEFIGFYPTRPAVSKAMRRPEILYLAGISAQRHHSCVNLVRTYKDVYEIHMAPASGVSITHTLRDETNAMILAVNALQSISDVPYLKG